MNISYYISARLYGYTLGRAYRNDPSTACQDAITQFMIVVGVPGLCAVLLIFASFYPALLASKVMPRAYGRGRGFTLIEVLVALAIVTLGMAPTRINLQAK